MQFLLNKDGSVPGGTNVLALESAGVKLAIPTDPPPLQANEIAVDAADPVMIEGRWYQRWVVQQAPTPPRVTKMTPLEFLDRIPFEAQLRIQTAEDGNPVVKLILKRLTMAVEIDLESPQTIQGVQTLLQAGIISQEEASLLLTVQ